MLFGRRTMHDFFINFMQQLLRLIIFQLELWGHRVLGKSLRQSQFHPPLEYLKGDWRWLWVAKKKVSGTVKIVEQFHLENWPSYVVHISQKKLWKELYYWSKIVSNYTKGKYTKKKKLSSVFFLFVFCFFNILQN